MEVGTEAEEEAEEEEAAEAVAEEAAAAAAAAAAAWTAAAAAAAAAFELAVGAGAGASVGVVVAVVVVVDRTAVVNGVPVVVVRNLAGLPPLKFGPALTASDTGLEIDLKKLKIDMQIIEYIVIESKNLLSTLKGGRHLRE